MVRSKFIFGRKFSTAFSIARNDNLKIARLLVGSTLGGVFLYGYLSDCRAEIYNSVVMPLMHQLDPEDSHRLSIWFAKNGLSPRETKCVRNSNLTVKLWGKEIDNPIGLAAGYDKNAEAVDALLGLGFGTVEIGSVTPLSQKGNPKPRFFRLPEDEAVINRYGFNSDGHAPVASRLQTRLRNWMRKRDLDPVNDEMDIPLSLNDTKLLGVNLGKNKYSAADNHSDYVLGVERLGQYADYLVINISSPNTPGLRELQRREPIEQLLTQVKTARDKNLKHAPPMLVKISPDCSETELKDIAAVVQSVGIDGIIISNTTITRPSTLKSDSKLIKQMGGLSGTPVKSLSLKTVSMFYKLTNGKVPIIGCGGISSAEDALEFAKAGASMVQLYTALGYQGPGLVAKIKSDLIEILKNENKSWTECIGLNHKQ